MPIRIQVEYLVNINILDIIWSSFLLLIPIKNASPENPENQNSEIAKNTSEAGT